MTLTSEVEGSTTSPYQSGHDHGCDDASISEKSERYIEQPEKGPDFHTKEFMAGYYDGISECGGEIIEEERGEDIDREVPVDVLLSHSNTGTVNVCVYTINDDGDRHGDCEEIALYGEGYESPYLVEGNTVDLNYGTNYQACASLPSGEDEKCSLQMIIGSNKETVELDYYIGAPPSSSVSTGPTLSVASEDERSTCYFNPNGGPHVCIPKNYETKSTTSSPSNPKPSDKSKSFPIPIIKDCQPIEVGPVPGEVCYEVDVNQQTGSARVVILGQDIGAGTKLDLSNGYKQVYEIPVYNGLVDFKALGIKVNDAKARLLITENLDITKKELTLELQFQGKWQDKPFGPGVWHDGPRTYMKLASWKNL